MQPDIIDSMIGAPGAAPAAHPDRDDARNPLVQHYRTRDGRYLALVMVDADRHWSNLCDALGEPELATDPRFVDHEARRRNSRACVERLDEVFARRDLDDWCEALRGCDRRVGAGPMAVASSPPIPRSRRTATWARPSWATARRCRW